MPEVVIRDEQPADADAIGRITVAAFAGAAYGHHGEAGIVEALRADGALTVSLVAVRGGEAVGHVAFSPVSIAGAAGGWYGLGPVSVDPAHQRQGIGQALIRAGLDRLGALDAAGCVLLGDPDYYRRFGFASDPALYYANAPAPYFQRLILKGAAPRGEAVFHPAFGETA
jgi:predicted N-acetyltransferase YhbS